MCSSDLKRFKSKEFKLVFSKSEALEGALIKLGDKVKSAVKKGNVLIHLIEEMPRDNMLSINALLATGYIHQQLINEGLRTDANIIVSTASARDTHSIACLISYGATAVYPWLAFQSILDLTNKGELKGSPKIGRAHV